MSTEVEPTIEAPEVLTDTPTDAEATISFNEGYAEPAFVMPTVLAPPAVTPETVVPVKDPVVVPSPYVQLTHEQLKELQATAGKVSDMTASIEKQFGTTFGKMGGLERTVRELQAAPTRDAPVYTAEDFEELSANGFPELAAMLVKDLNRVSGKVSRKPEPVVAPSAVFDAAAMETLVTQRIAAATEQVSHDHAIDLLTMQHPDWKAVVGAPESETPYRTWLKTQPTAYQQSVLDTWRPAEASASIQLFKTSQLQAANAAVEVRKNRFAAAVPVKGDGRQPAGKSEIDDFNDGYKEG